MPPAPYWPLAAPLAAVRSEGFADVKHPVATGPADSASVGVGAREVGVFGASTIVYQGSRFLFSIAAASVLAPADFSGWGMMLALLVYAPALMFGVNNGMAREVPVAIGANHLEVADRAVGVTWAVAGLAVALVMAAALLASAVAPLPSVNVIAAAVLVSGTIVYGVQQFILRSRLRFVAASVQQGALGLLMLSATTFLASLGTADFVAVAALYGVPLATAVIVGFGLDRKLVSVRLVADEGWRLASVGFPIMLAGLVFSLLVTLDRWLAVSLLGPEEAAPYALASLMAAAMLVAPTVVSQQTYPRMAIARGRGAGSVELLAMARTQGLLAAGLVAPVAAALCGIAIFGVPLLLPQYEAAVPSVVLLTSGFVVLAYLTGYGNYLNVVGAQWRYLGSQLAGVAVALVLAWAGGVAFGLSGIAAGMALGHIAYGGLLRSVATRTDISLGRLPRTVAGRS